MNAKSNKDSKMFGFMLSITLMSIALLCIKKRVVLYIFWFVCCFVPFFMFVYDGESSNLHYAYEIGTKEAIEVWCGILFVSFIISLGMLAIAIFIKYLFSRFIKSETK